jgi:hypothetical protein
MMAKKISKSSSQKMEIWELLKDVPQQAQKTFRRQGGFSGTDVSPQWRMKRLTEVFGPAGCGWGYEIKSNWESKDCCFVLLEGWYKWGNEIHKIPATIGGTQMSRTPDESYKMAVTDAFGKSFSQIGLAATVYLGEDFSGSKYASSSSIERLEMLIEEKGANLKTLLSHYKVKNLEAMNEKQANEAAEILINK